MRLRTKMLLPPLLAFALLEGFVHLYWQPNRIEQAKQQFSTHTQQLLTATRVELVRSLLERDYVSAFNTMEVIQTSFDTHWYNVTLYDEAGKRVYPLFPGTKKRQPPPADMVRQLHPIALSTRHLGRIELDADWSAERSRVEQETRGIHRIMVALLVVIVGVSLLTEYRLLFRPFTRLKAAAKALAKSGTGTASPFHGEIPDDEVGELMLSFNEMAQSIFDQSSRLRAVFDTAVDGIVVIDSSGQIKEFSPAAEQIFGYSKQEAIGRNVSLLMRDRDGSAHDAYLANYVDEPVPERIMGKVRELVGQRKNGDVFPMDLAVGETRIGDKLFFTGIVRDVTERKLTEEELHNNQQGLLALAQKLAGLGSWELDLQTNHLTWSEQLYRLLGIAPHTQSLSFDDFFARVHPDDLQYVKRAHQGLFATDATYDIEYRLLIDNELKYVNERSDVIRGPNGEATKVVCSLLDVTKRVLEAEHLVNAKGQAVAQAKSTFLANIGHEIRTPMDTIIGMTALTRRTNLDQRQADYIGAIHDTAQGLLQLVDNILDVAKIETGGVSLERVEFRLDTLRRRVEGVVGALARDKGLRFTLNVDDELPAMLVGDMLRLSQVLINLGRSVINLTPDSGRIAIDIGAIELDDDAIVLRASVIGDDIHMTQQQVENLFHPASQDGTAEQIPGENRLELTIAQNLVEAMHGKIEVRADTARGSVFSFTTRVGRGRNDNAEGSPDAGDAHPDNRRKKPLAGKHVLLVEDNELNRRVTTDLLESFGLTVEVAHDGEQALERLGEQDFDGVLMDCMMPVMDGYEATRQIRQDPRFAELPIIAVTANTMPRDRERCLAVGMNDHIGKPVDVDQMLKIIRMWLDGTATRPAPEPLADEPLTWDLPGIDTALGMAVARGKPAFYHKMLRRFLTEKADFEGQFRAARTDTDPDAAMRAAHSLKGIAATVGAHALSDSAAALEAACRDEPNNIEQCLDAVLPELDIVMKGIENLDEYAEDKQQYSVHAG